mmetsp:Transcript_35041/g.97823  ORF Transcript_35041/g.97823 Transcript_35041/m.97823 type:complete len:204 (+) Transcript_35041:99-710(+)
MQRRASTSTRAVPPRYAVVPIIPSPHPVQPSTGRYSRCSVLLEVLAAQVPHLLAPLAVLVLVHLLPPLAQHAVQVHGRHVAARAATYTNAQPQVQPRPNGVAAIDRRGRRRCSGSACAGHDRLTQSPQRAHAQLRRCTCTINTPSTRGSWPVRRQARGGRPRGRGSREAPHATAAGPQRRNVSTPRHARRHSAAGHHQTCQGS